MKKSILTLPILIGLSLGSNAGESYSAKSAKAVIPPPVEECRLQWFAAASVGYLTDVEEPMYHLQFGLEKLCPTHSHALYLEVGFTEFDDTYPDPQLGDLDIDVEIIPITLNYKYERPLTQNLNWYIGVGAGVALVDMDAQESGDPAIGFDDTVFYAQAFTGLVYNVNEAFEIFGGVRYIYMDDPDLSGAPYDNIADIDGDILVELGARYNF